MNNFIFKTKFFLFFLGSFIFCHFGVVHAEAKVDAQTLRDVNVGVKSVDNIKLVLKKFFTSPKDTHQINRDMIQFAKATKRINWHFEARGNDLFLRSNKKTLFKFRLISEGKKVSDFIFNFNGRKFAINPDHSYSWHKKKMEDILGLSRQSLFETFIIKEARALFFLVPLALAAINAYTWSRKSQAAETPSGHTGGSPASTSTTSPTSTDVPFSSDCSDDEKLNFYGQCFQNEWGIFEPSLREDECTHEYCDLTLDHTHFKKMDINSKKYPDVWADLKRKCEERKTQERVNSQTASEMCDKDGYLIWDRQQGEKSLRRFLSSIVKLDLGDYQKPVKGESRPDLSRLKGSFDMNKCQKTVEEPPRTAIVKNNGTSSDDATFLTEEGTWGMKEEWAKKYCKAAKSRHESCANAAKQCSGTPLPSQPHEESPARGTLSEG